MKNFFKFDGPLFTALTQLADLAILNILTLLLCLPVVTAGASLTAMNYVVTHIVRSEGGSIVKMYFHSFRENFKQSTLIWLLVLAIGFLLYLDWSIMPNFEGAVYQVIRIAWVMLMFIYIGWLSWLFALLSRYVNTAGKTMRNAFSLMLGCFPRTLGMVAVWGVDIFINYSLGIHGIPLLILFGLSLPGFFCALLYNPVFKKLEGDDKNGNAQAGGTGQ